MPSEKFMFERAIEDAVKHISEQTQHALNESRFKPKEIAERMNMGNPALVKSVLESGNVEHMQMGTLVRLIHACGLEMHVRFVTSLAEDEGRVIKRKAAVEVPPPGMLVDDE